MAALDGAARPPLLVEALDVRPLLVGGCASGVSEEQDATDPSESTSGSGCSSFTVTTGAITSGFGADVSASCCLVCLCECLCCAGTCSGVALLSCMVYIPVVLVFSLNTLPEVLDAGNGALDLNFLPARLVSLSGENRSGLRRVLLVRTLLSSWGGSSCGSTLMMICSVVAVAVSSFSCLIVVLVVVCKSLSCITSMAVCSSIDVSVSSFSCLIVAKVVVIVVVCMSSSSSTSVFILTTGATVVRLPPLLVLVLAVVLLVSMSVDVDGCGDGLSAGVSGLAPLVFTVGWAETLWDRVLRLAVVSCGGVTVVVVVVVVSVVVPVVVIDVGVTLVGEVLLVTSMVVVVAGQGSPSGMLLLLRLLVEMGIGVGLCAGMVVLISALPLRVCLRVVGAGETLGTEASAGTEILTGVVVVEVVGVVVVLAIVEGVELGIELEVDDGEAGTGALVRRRGGVAIEADEPLEVIAPLFLLLCGVLPLLEPSLPDLLVGVAAALPSFPCVSSHSVSGGRSNNFSDWLAVSSDSVSLCQSSLLDLLAEVAVALLSFP